MARGESDNRWERYVYRLADEIRNGSDAMVDEMRGGKHAPFTRGVPRQQLITDYLECSVDPALLRPDEAEHWWQTWNRRYAGRTREELADHHLAMQKLIEQEAGRGAGEANDDSDAETEAA